MCKTEKSAHTKDTQMSLLPAGGSSSLGEKSRTGHCHLLKPGVCEHGGYVTDKHLSGGAQGGRTEVTEHPLRHLTCSCFLCAPKVSPEPSPLLVFITLYSLPRGYFSFLKAQTPISTHPAEGACIAATQEAFGLASPCAGSLLAN